MEENKEENKFEWELTDKYLEHAKFLNVEIVGTKRNERNQQLVVFHCLNHPNKSNRISYAYSFLHAKSCGCRLKCYTEEDFIEDIADKEVKLYGKYKNDTEKTEFVCEYRHVFSARPNKIKRGEGCPECKKRKLRERFIKDKKWYVEKLAKINPSLEVVGEYNGMEKDITCKCKVCGRLTTTKADKFTTMQTGCHFCKLSIGESIIYTYLEDHNINFDSQKRFDDCKHKQLLPFDFYLPDYNVCIEYQGEQHYKPVDFSYTPTEESKQKAIKKFEDGQKRDKVKKDYCQEKGIYLLEISYKDKKRLVEILDDFFNNFNRNSNDCHT